MIRTPPSPCWHCGGLLDAATGVGHEQHKVQPGAISICMKCGQPGIFALDLTPRAPTDDEWLRIGADKELQAMLLFAQEYIKREREKK